MTVGIGSTHNIKRIELATRRLAQQGFAGAYHSAFKGQGVAFSSVRPYMPGDDVRSLDWNITARMGDPYVKEFTEDRELTLMLLMDMSGSFQVSTTLPSRRDYAAEIGAVFAMSASLNQDRVGFIGFTRTIECLAPPKRDRNHLLRLLKLLFTYSAQERGTDISNALIHVGAALKQRSLVIIISDFLTSHSDWGNALQQLSYHHDVIAICIRDPREHTLPDSGLIGISDAETDNFTVIDSHPASVREAYNTLYRQQLEQLKSLLDECHIDSVFLATGENYLPIFSRLFQQRIRRA
jgi:uncharacterized protein (DUF58 family)